ncbi:hypothetical protein DPMN_027892 [Dreissena polymorpha]|uniref:Uncharacterized protein n=1 Tax=Dreissena polymorpha TaxID=45954 RepID=A0A9D4LVM8_DREPO|nr:hypothetical protein DPMN_027892 [Dreissena polymorpha]
MGDLSNTSGSDEAIQNIPADLNYDSDAGESSLDNSIVSNNDFGYRSDVDTSDTDAVIDEVLQENEPSLQEKLSCWVTKHNPSRSGTNKITCNSSLRRSL